MNKPIKAKNLPLFSIIDLLRFFRIYSRCCRRWAFFAQAAEQ